MGVESFSDRRRSSPNFEANRSAGSRIAAEDTGCILRQDAGATCRAREKATRDAKTVCFSPPLTIDASVCTDQPAVSSAERKRGDSDASEGCKREDPSARTRKIKRVAGRRRCDGETSGTSGEEEKVARETCTWRKVARGTHTWRPARGDQLGERELSPTKLSEMINNSIKEAVQTIVEQRSMDEKKLTSARSEEAGKGSLAYRTCVTEELSKNPPKARDDEGQKGCHVPWRPDYFFTRGDSRLWMHDDNNNVTPVLLAEKTRNDRRARRHSKPASNVNTNNRRMTGNVNIYICSETNGNGQSKGERLKSQSCTDTSSDATGRQQSNARHGSASSSSSNRLINRIQEKRRKLQKQRLPNFVRDKIDDDAASDARVRDNGAFLHQIRETSPEVYGSAQTTTRAVDEDAAEMSSTRDGCCCRDASLIDIPRHSSSSMAPCCSPSLCDDLRLPSPSWITIYPAARDRLESSDVSSIAICGRVVEDESGRERDDICYRAINKDARSPMSTCADCPAEHGSFEECCADNRRSGELSYSVNRNKIRMSWPSREPSWQSSVGNSVRGECAARRRWSACSCITEEEEEENYCASVERKELSGRSSRDDATERPEKMCDYWTTTCGKLVSGCVTPDVAGEGLAKISTRESALAGSESRRGDAAPACGTTLENSTEVLEVTGVCKKFVTGELPRGIAICGAILAEPKGSSGEEAAAVCASQPPPVDRGDSPKKTICKISDWNSAGRNDAKRVSLNDMRDKLAKGRTNGVNLNKGSGSAANAKRVTILSDGGSGCSGAATSNNPVDDCAPRRHGDSANERTRTNVSPSNPSGSPGAPPPLRAAYLEPRGRPNQPLIRSAKDTPRNPVVDRSKTERAQLASIRRSQRSNATPRDTMPSATRDLASVEVKQIDAEEAQEKPKKQDENGRDGSRETAGSTDERSRVAILRLSLKKLLDAIRRARERLKMRMEAARGEKVKTGIGDDEGPVVRPTGVPEEEDKIGDGRRGVGERDASTTSARASEQELTGTIADKPKPSAPPADVTVLSEGDSRMGTSGVDRAARLKAAVLRLIAAKRSRLRSFPLRTTRPAETTVVAAERVDKREIPSEDSPEPVSAKVDDEAELSIVPEIMRTVEEISEVPIDKLEATSSVVFKDVSKDIADFPRVEVRVSTDVARDETTELPVPEEKAEKESRKLVFCECGAFHDPADRPCAPIAKYVRCDRTLQNRDGVQCVTEAKDFREISARYTCASSQRRKRRPEVDAPRFRRDVSPRGGPRFCRSCRPVTRGDCECGEKSCLRCYRGRRARLRDYSRTTDRRGSPADCASCCRPRDRCRCATPPERGDLERGRRGKMMICLYCDKPRDKCECRGPIRRCSCCDLPSDVCGCPDDDDNDDDVRVRRRRRRAGRPNESGTIRVTSWKPKRDVERYFARDLETRRRADDCRCSEKPKRQRLEELPYQRLNVFSDVINELQRKMSESACCARCGRNPCCCGARLDQDKAKGERRVEGYIRCPEAARPGRVEAGRSPNDCRCGSIPASLGRVEPRRRRRRNVVIESTPNRRPDCACKLSPCKCGRTSRRRKPLAKCYYCKSLPCACIAAS